MNTTFIDCALVVALVAVAIEILVLVRRFVCFKRGKYPFSFAEYAAIFASRVDGALVGVALVMVIFVLAVLVFSPLAV